MHQDDEESIHYLVVINAQAQYSIWPDFKPIPGGWRAVDKQGTKMECLAYIKEIWTDMRPKSLQDLMNNSNSTS